MVRNETNQFMYIEANDWFWLSLNANRWVDVSQSEWWIWHVILWNLSRQQGSHFSPICLFVATPSVESFIDPHLIADKSLPSFSHRAFINLQCCIHVYNWNDCWNPFPDQIIRLWFRFSSTKFVFCYMTFNSEDPPIYPEYRIQHFIALKDTVANSAAIEENDKQKNADPILTHCSYL